MNIFSRLLQLSKNISAIYPMTKGYIALFGFAGDYRNFLMSLDCKRYIICTCSIKIKFAKMTLENKSVSSAIFGMILIIVLFSRIFGGIRIWLERNYNVDCNPQDFLFVGTDYVAFTVVAPFFCLCSGKI